MSTLSFRELHVYQLAEQLAGLVWTMVADWPQFAKETIGKQIVRSADSVGANIAEGTGRGTYQDNRRFVTYARGSLYETQHFLRQSHHRNLITKDTENKLKPIIEELPKRLNAYLSSIGRKADTASGE